MAYGAIEGLKDSGKRVPEDVSVIGVDDSLVGTVPRLSLTTMRMDFETIGRGGENTFPQKPRCLFQRS